MKVFFLIYSYPSLSHLLCLLLLSFFFFFLLQYFWLIIHVFFSCRISHSLSSLTAYQGCYLICAFSHISWKLVIKSIGFISFRFPFFFQSNLTYTEIFYFVDQQPRTSFPYQLMVQPSPVMSVYLGRETKSTNYLHTMQS